MLDKIIDIVGRITIIIFLLIVACSMMYGCCWLVKNCYFLIRGFIK